MTFWGVEVKPDEPFTLKSEDFGGTLMLTQATLGHGSSSEKSILQVKVGDKNPIFICSLLPEKSESFSLNLEFDEEDDVTFSVLGPTSIHLSGMFQEAEPEGEYDGDEFDSDPFGEGIAETDSEDSEFESEDDSEDDLDDDDDMPLYPPSTARKSGVVIEEIEDEEKPVSVKAGNKQAKKNKENAKLQENTGGKIIEKGKAKEKKNGANDDGEATGSLKRKVDAMDKDQEPKINGTDAIEGDSSKKKNKKNKKKKAKIENDETVANSKQNDTDVATPKQVKDKEENKTSKAVTETKQPKDKPAKVKTFPNGLIIEDVEMGKPSGRTASRGKKVSVRYIGKLKKGGKIFDSNTSGKPFKFRLGAGEVIKGWDVGVEGMRVGGKRRLTIPPTMGYGSAGAKPQIPANAWLVFDVELVEVA
ncbi:peptidyl-prolyl cis-trans isomerase FKBP53-like [Silene latifolia]|uniref:peptidyl-prolyl cis-trans isomerase FKBP53-like n=1 Tax=Silene latifolia TaxID=37657 RepID=UPI003D76AF9E